MQEQAETQDVGVILEVEEMMVEVVAAAVVMDVEVVVDVEVADVEGTEREKMLVEICLISIK